ncbi:MAG TPA: hypothetical protein VF246_10240 [Acidimicrobiia bacterium]|nr:hypothetical protein [uncultured bacterium]
MTDLHIQGGAGEFEAAVIAIVIDHLAREEAAARALGGQPDSMLPAWVRATPQLTPDRVFPAAPSVRR